MDVDLSQFSLAGRVALVTGASRGLGLAMATGLADAGATVVLNGRVAQTLERQAADLCEGGRKAETAAFDATDEEAAAAAVEAILARHGRLDIFIGNAGLVRRAPLEERNMADWDEIVATNLRANFVLARLAAAPMKRAGWGRIIFTTSLTGILGRATIHAYVASKAGLAGLARSLAAELGEFGITCNTISPGYFATELNTAMLADRAFVDKVNARVPLRRWGKPAEVGGVAVFLASAAGSYVNGQQIAVDGGYSTTM
jgi:gluconate 5-dehydrogenase